MENKNTLHDFYQFVDNIKLKLNIMKSQLIDVDAINFDKPKYLMEQLEQEFNQIISDHNNSLFMSESIKKVLQQYHDPKQVTSIEFILKQLSSQNKKKNTLLYHIQLLDYDDKQKILSWYKDHVAEEIKNDKDIILDLIQDYHIQQYKEQNEQFNIDEFFDMIMNEEMKKRYRQHKKRIQSLFMKQYSNLI